MRDKIDIEGGDMAYGVENVGDNGEVVIDGVLREELGIGPGWFALQKVVDGHLEVEFLPPEHNESLAGAAAEYVKGDEIPADADWGKIRDEVWAKAVREDF